MIDAGVLLRLAAVLVPVYFLALVIHRLYFNRIAHIPGPRLAAITYFYQFYYDVYPHKGQFMFHYVDLHKKYGPIIRIGPDEIHINDIAFYNDIYPNTTRRRDKPALWFWMHDVDEFAGKSAFSTLNHHVHRMRRSAFGQYFSRQRVLELQPRIVDKVERLRDNLLKRKGTDELVDLRDACSALTLEVITEYVFGRPIEVLETDDWANKWNEALRIGARMHPVGRTFPALLRGMLKLPQWLMEYDPNFEFNRRFQGEVNRVAKEAFNDAMRDEKVDENRVTVLHEMINSDALPPEEKTLKRITNDASIFVGAGMETTGRTLAIILYYVLSDARIHKRLKEELRAVIPSSSAPIPDVATLEKLPYLTAVLTEGTRMGHGTPGRLARTAPEEDLVYQGIKIPRGTVMSQSSWLLHTNPQIFPDPSNFQPERYLGPGDTEAQKSLVPFGRGSRMCVGLNLAWAELYLTIAVLLTSVNMELRETTERDATIVAEYFVGDLPRDSKGIRVKILGEL